MPDEKSWRGDRTTEDVIGVLVSTEGGNPTPVVRAFAFARNALQDILRGGNFDWIEIATANGLADFVRWCRRGRTPEGFVVDEPKVPDNEPSTKDVEERHAIFAANSDTGRAIVDELLARTNAHVSRWLRDVRHTVSRMTAEEIFEDPAASWRVRSLNFEDHGTFLYRWSSEPSGTYGVYSRRSLADALETCGDDELQIVLAVAKS